MAGLREKVEAELEQMDAQAPVQNPKSKVWNPEVQSLTSDFLISRKLTGVGFAPASGTVQKQERAVNHPVIGFGSGQRV